MRGGFWMHSIRLVALSALLGLASAQSPALSRQSLAKLVDIGPTGIDIKRPVFAGACKACPWGVLASITQAALKPYGYDVKICWVCWSSFGPREMADKTKPVLPPGAEDNPYDWIRAEVSFAIGIAGILPGIGSSWVDVLL